ncbi:PIG-L deacetylase family protein [Cellulomonas sp. URHD0024]|uniref:PIG-L deacetylase family protein n=1 Tax=Cellulomonas sp. URHD0024 TaxID=1302620 RepID=UPI0004244010|nr:PIG-L deacetylase family protein [Cellulomonas sp. URHD0024]
MDPNAEHGVEPLDEDWSRLLAVVAHPDDLEYGAASAVARWTAAGKWVGYLVVTHGEAGMADTVPREAREIRRAEQVASAAVVGVRDVWFLDHPDGLVEYGPALRRDITRVVRRTAPDRLLTATERLTFGARQLNQPDHRAVALATLDAAKDAANRWIFPELAADEGLEPHAGVRAVLTMGSGAPTHGVDVTDWLDAGARSLRCHARYLASLGRPFDPAVFLRDMTAAGGLAMGVPHAVLLERFDTASV